MSLFRVIIPLLVPLMAAAQSPEPALSASPSETIQVLVVDGFGNHDWQRTTRLLVGLLSTRPEFRCEVSTVPARATDPAHADWRPDFSRYDVVIQTCNDINGAGSPWPQKACRDFESYVANGGGVYVFHSANNAFPGWDAYNRMLGLGWRGKDQGTAIRVLPDESLERIPPGQGESTSHGARTDRVIHRLGEHPLHIGLPKMWSTPLIEVYTHPRGPAESLEILSWAEDPATSTRWPVEWTTRYGKGRVLTSTFGHVWHNEADPVDLRCAGFQTLLIRSLHWLAKRTVPAEVPADFPTATRISLRRARADEVSR